MFERASNYFASRIGIILNLDKERQEVIAYGAFGVIQMFWSIILTIIFGVVFNVLNEILIISFTAAILRKFSGGAHATSPNRCAVLGVLVFGCFALAIKGFLENINIIFIAGYSVLALITSYVIVFNYAPVDNPNKPIKKEETKKRLKKASLICLHVLLLITFILITVSIKIKDKTLFTYTVAVCTGMIWQSITLTPFGHQVIYRLDALLKKSTRLIGVQW